MAKTQAQKNAEKKAKAEAEAKKKADEQAQQDAGAGVGPGEGPDEGPDAPPGGEPKAVDDGAVHFCSRFKRYRCRGTQFDNYRVRVSDQGTIAKLKADPKFGFEFWVCDDQQGAA